MTDGRWIVQNILHDLDQMVVIFWDVISIPASTILDNSRQGWPTTHFVFMLSHVSKLKSSLWDANSQGQHIVKAFAQVRKVSRWEHLKTICSIFWAIFPRRWGRFYDIRLWKRILCYFSLFSSLPYLLQGQLQWSDKVINSSLDFGCCSLCYYNRTP